MLTKLLDKSVNIEAFPDEFNTSTGTLLHVLNESVEYIIFALFPTAIAFDKSTIYTLFNDSFTLIISTQLFPLFL